MEIQPIKSQEFITTTRKINVGNIYKHYKGNFYKVLAIGHHSEDPTTLYVTYQALYDCPTFGQKPIWVRPYTMFAENIVLNGKEQPRFEELTETTEDTFHLGVKAIIRNSSNRILLLRVEKTTKNYWDLPGSRIRIGENFESALKREVNEETGITQLNNIRHLGMITSATRIPINQNQTVGLIFSFYSCSTDTDIITLSSEHQAYEWVTSEKAVVYLQSTYGEAFKKYFE